MRILVVGKGGREHTLIWKIKQSPKVSEIFCAPGNAGTAQIANNVQIGTEDITQLREFGLKNKIDLTVVGPEARLVKGIVSEFTSHGLKIFGPTKQAAILEGSKVFAKNLMKKYGVPSAEFVTFTNPDEADEYVKSKGAPMVVKANGLAAGKGVIVAQTVEEAIQALHRMMREKHFGEAGNEVIIEECLMGEEASVLAFTDGKTIIPMASAQDHKPIFDEDKGPNTGGMGAYSPAPVVTPQIMKRIQEEILKPTIFAMHEEGNVYKGVLYLGLMITREGPKVLEYNARFGDPETQAQLPRMKTDLVEVMEAVIENRLEEIKIEWDPRAAVCVVMASGGYPDPYKKGYPISGLEEASKLKEVMVFHAGTTLKEGKVVTNGGRVLGVTALGKTIKEAIDRSYDAVKRIHFEGVHYRKDIGKKALKWT